MKITWKLMAMYLLVIVLVLMSSFAFGQNICKKDVCVVEFNASWNEANSVDYLDELTECGVKRISIDEGSWQEDYNIVVVPTIIVFNGDEVKRFQADISFTVQAKLEDVQSVIDEIIMSSF
tara:strand:- start:24 stop:386 length:363 start_codon:yes stop_codon:yes gene_type:complete